MPALRERIDARIVGVAGPRMRDAGVESVARAEDLTGFGLAEVIPRLPRYLRALREIEAAAVRSGAQVALTVDAPSLWLRLGRRLRGRGLSVLHWVAPQVWAWRPERARTVAASVDAVLCLLPFEPALFAGHVRAVFVGHPAAAIVGRPAGVQGSPVVALCPGSRPSEVAALWPVFRAVAQRVRARHPDAAFVVPVAPTIGSLGGLDATYVRTMAEVAGADVALTASGTATIELAALDVPMVVAYRVHPLTAAIARRVLTVPRVALPNVLAGEGLVPEHLQDLDPDRLAEDVLAWAGRRGQVPRELIASLDGPAALGRTADEVSAWLRAARGGGGSGSGTRAR